MSQRVCWLPLVALVSGLLAVPAGAQDSHPNVLLLAVDDLNDWVGALGGHPQAKTPNLDRLARRGTLFSNAHCQAPVCAPSRASLATGRMPSSTGMYFLTPSLAQATDLRASPTLVERFAAEGYETMGVGKIHHGDEVPFFDRYGGSMGGFGPRPKQKLAYKIGQLKILQIRERAEVQLGDRFDIRAFHDELLGAGALPLDLLEQRMDRWMAAQ